MEGNVLFYSSLTLVLLITLITSVAEGFDVHTATLAGIVNGKKTHLVELNKEIEIYLGVRYATAPIRELRFKEPVPAPKNPQSSLGLSEFPPTCPQSEFETFKGFRGMEPFQIRSRIDEDCLFLNIWKPIGGLPKKPVLVWIHGGGFSHGSTSIPLYDGSYLAAWTDAVVVSIQYRLGAFGFLYTGDDFAPGNAGLKDQVLALKWVKEHINKFGGDKEMITIVGESAGGSSVGIHVLSPDTSKLFKRAIMLSGVPNCPWAVIDPFLAKERAFSLLANFDANASNYEDIKKRLIEKDWNDVVEATKLIHSDHLLKLVFWPTIEPKVIPDYPLHTLRNSNHLYGKEMIASFTKNECSMFVAIALKSSKKIETITDTPQFEKEDLLERLALVAGENENFMAELLKIYNQTSYLNGVLQFDDDVHMKCPINQFVEESRNLGAIVYQFEYDHRSRNNPWPDWAGTVHTSDLEMFFGRPIYQKELYDDRDVELCAKFMNRIKNFIQTGNPNVAGLEIWSKNEMLVVGQGHKNVDNRTSVCNKLKKLKMMTTYTSGINRLQINLFGFFGLIAFIIVFI